MPKTIYKFTKREPEHFPGWQSARAAIEAAHGIEAVREIQRNVVRLSDQKKAFVEIAADLNATAPAAVRSQAAHGTTELWREYHNQLTQEARTAFYQKHRHTLGL